MRASYGSSRAGADLRLRLGRDGAGVAARIVGAFGRLADGLGGLVGGLIEYTRSLMALNKEHRVSLWSPALIMAIALMCSGVYVAYDIFYDQTP